MTTRLHWDLVKLTLPLFSVSPAVRVHSFVQLGLAIHNHIRFMDDNLLLSMNCTKMNINHRKDFCL